MTTQTDAAHREQADAFFARCSPDDILCIAEHHTGRTPQPGVVVVRFGSWGTGVLRTNYGLHFFTDLKAASDARRDGLMITHLNGLNEPMHTTIVRLADWIAT